MCLHTTTYVSSYYYMCPHTNTYVSSYYYMWPHTTVCVLILLYVSSYYYTYAGEKNEIIALSKALKRAVKLFYYHGEHKDARGQDVCPTL
jgi:hypothetical protein